VSAFEQAQALLAEGREQAAVALLEAAADANDPAALSCLGDWRIYGLHGPQDQAAGRRYVERAAALGDVEAARKLAFLTAGGIGGPSDVRGALEMLQQIAPRDDYAALQLRLLMRFRSLDHRAPAKRELLSADPRIELVREVFLPDECRYLVWLAEPRLQPAFVIDDKTGQNVPSPVRSAHNMGFLPTQEDLIVHAINRRLADATGTHVSWGEPLSILRYTTKQEYRPHLDAMPRAANQRIVTALIYLNDDYTGGETQFTDLGVTVRGGVGDVLIFRNALPDGSPDERTFHAGLPVQDGVKWLASRWIRQRTFDHCLSGLNFEQILQ
jgi:prolyl 4-hydroxylase